MAAQSIVRFPLFVRVVNALMDVTRYTQRNKTTKEIIFHIKQLLFSNSMKMRKIKIMHLVSKNDLNYIVEIDSINHSTTSGFMNLIFLSGYVVDSNNICIPTGQRFCFSIRKHPSDNLLEPNSTFTSGYKMMEELDIIKFPNWFERLWETLIPKGRT